MSVRRQIPDAMELELYTETTRTGSKPEEHKPLVDDGTEHVDAADLSSDSFAETDIDGQSSEGDDSWGEGVFAGDERDDDGKKTKGTQTEWSWTADIVAYANLRGIDIKDLEQVPYPESARSMQDADSGTAIDSSPDLVDKEQCCLDENAQESVIQLPEIVPTEEPIIQEPIYRLEGFTDVESCTPTILKYVRESELPPRPSTVPCEKQIGYNKALCRVCNNSIPLNDSQDLPSLYCTSCSELVKSHRAMKHNVEREITMIDIRLRKQPVDKDMKEEEEDLLGEKVNMKVKRRLGREKAMAKIKEKELMQKLHEQDLARQRVSGINHVAMDDDYGMYDKNMKTIFYSLSSQKCMDKGWTLQPKPTPIRLPDYDGMGVEMRVDHFTMTHETVVRKEYEDGRPFLLFMPDGTGQCYYPSGVPAVSVSAVQYRQFTYVIKSDVTHYRTNETVEEVESQILACFTPSGYACCYHTNGIPYLIMTPVGGSVYASDGSQRKKWLWNSRGHCHSPPLQPLCLALSKYLTVRLSNQENIILTFSCQQRTARFIVGWKGPLRQDSSLSSRTVDSQASYLKSAQKHINGLIIAIQEAERHPKSFAHRITSNVGHFRTLSAPGKLLTKSSPSL